MMDVGEEDGEGDGTDEGDVGMEGEASPQSLPSQLSRSERKKLKKQRQLLARQYQKQFFSLSGAVAEGSAEKKKGAMPRTPIKSQRTYPNRK
jgi:hypothetical protein